jgi:hypothetical protein
MSTGKHLHLFYTSPIYLNDLDIFTPVLMSRQKILTCGV